MSKPRQERGSWAKETGTGKGSVPKPPPPPPTNPARAQYSSGPPAKCSPVVSLLAPYIVGVGCACGWHTIVGTYPAAHEAAAQHRRDTR